MASPPRSPTAAAATLSRLRACSAQLLGLRAFADVFGGGGSGGSAASSSLPADRAAGNAADCRETDERSERCVVVTREGVRLLRCTETLRRLRTCAGAPSQEVEVVEGTTLRRLGGGGGGVAASTVAATPAAAATATTAGLGRPPPPGGSIVLNPEASEVLQEFMGYADFLASERGGGGGGGGGGS